MRHLILLFLLSMIIPVFNVKAEPTADDRQSYSIFVDQYGTMRRSDTNEEVSYYGTNYTLPFAHAYRAAGYLAKDRKEELRKDVAHLARLGFNGFRLHLWDSELADDKGNLIENEHLDLLDYLISELEKRNIDIILTAQTNFGNGYPEKDIDTGAFTYDFPKCGIHEDAEARKIQENYLKQLVTHVNPYTGRSYADDKGIIAIEINNEPCHETTPDVVLEYINQMVGALKRAGYERPILYNVSHNDNVREAYYQADIDGTTFQWYPSGLVAGHERKGNFLPAVSEYNIPWKESMPRYDKLARVVYEFDPGDILGSYLYPAIARTFRKEGFQWITQFAYDPTFLAPYNTEYQTHYLNLLYTPAKALSMMIAGEAARTLPRNSDFGEYPVNNVFGPFSVDYEKNLSLLNDTHKFLYTNNTDVLPACADSLTQIAGVGSSPVVEYTGTGAYFLDKLDDNPVWRLEVLPDATIVSDPFEKSSLKKTVAALSFNNHPIKISLPGLPADYAFKGINAGNTHEGRAIENSFEVYPGTYLIGMDASKISCISLDEKVGNIGITEFAAAGLEDSETGLHPKITKPLFAEKGKDVEVTVEIPGTFQPDSVVIYPDGISFWRKDNPLIKMNRTGANTYSASMPGGNKDRLRYRVVVFKDDKATTFPGAVEGMPLDWDYLESDWYATEVVDSASPLFLLNPDKPQSIDLRSFNANGKWSHYEIAERTPQIPRNLAIYPIDEDGSETVMRAYIGDLVNEFPFSDSLTKLNIEIDNNSLTSQDITLAILTRDGATYGVKLTPSLESENNRSTATVTVPLKDLEPLTTYLIPEAFPSFMNREINVPNSGNINPSEIEFIELRMRNTNGSPIRIHGIWAE